MRKIDQKDPINYVQLNKTSLLATLIIISSALGITPAIYAKSSDTTLLQANVTPLTPPDTVQSGYNVHYTGSTSAIKAVSTNVDTLPSVNIPDGNSVVFFLLNTGDTTTCSGFMQVGVEKQQLNSWQMVYMNGQQNCTVSVLTPNGGISQSDKLTSKIQNGGSTTTYSVYDFRTGQTTSTTVTALTTWNKNNWESMTESTSVGASIGSFTWDSSQIVDPNGNTINLDKSNTNLSGFTEYGGACTDAIYAPGAWTNGPTYGYFESALSPAGHCVYTLGAVGTIGAGSISNVFNIEGGPDNLNTQLYGGNLNDGAYITTNLVGTYTGSFTGTLKIDGYSYNNGRGAYYSHVKVDTSTNCSTFTNIYSQTWNPSSTNTPSWITIGSVSNVQCVKVTAIDDTGNSANVFIDALRVGN